jgi:recombination protein U
LSRKHNLGDALENMIDRTCEAYTNQGVANISKVPTPYKIIGTDPRRPGVLLAVPERKSGVDYLGEYVGVPFAMESKKTENKTSYAMDPWDREQHQREFLKAWRGFKFYLIGFWTLGEFYLVRFEDYQEWHAGVGVNAEGRKSIPIAWFRSHAVEIKPGGRVLLDFLKAVDKYRGI